MSRLLRPENGVYFFHFGGQCLVWPFLPLFLRRYASDDQLGLILGACRVATVASAPLWSYVADARLGRGPIFAAAWIGWQILTLALLVVARHQSLAAAAAVAVARSAFEAPISPFIDAGVLARVPGGFGKARLFGSISWGLMAPVAGASYGAFGFAPNVVASIVVSVLMAVCAVRVVPRAAAKSRARYDAVVNPFSVEDDEAGGAPSAPDAATGGGAPSAPDATGEENPFAAPADEPPRAAPAPAPVADAPSTLDLVLGRRDLLVFLWVAAVVGAGFGFVMNFLFVYITRVLGGTPALCGVALFVECAVEVPVMNAADGIFRRRGARVMLLAVLALYACRCAGYAAVGSFDGKPWLVLLVEPLHGITFALFYVASTNHAKTLLPEGRETLAQGLFSAAFTGGTGVGAALGGVGARRFGYQATFLGFALVYVAATAAAWSALDDSSSRVKVDDRPVRDDIDELRDDLDVDDLPAFSFREDELGDWATPGGGDDYYAGGL